MEDVIDLLHELAEDVPVPLDLPDEDDLVEIEEALSRINSWTEAEDRLSTTEALKSVNFTWFPWRHTRNLLFLI